jgi:predicted metal-dependent peptidase
MSFDKLSLNQRIQAVNIDCMRHPQFARLAGIICMGKSEVKAGVPTAYTNGTDKVYGDEFIGDMTRKQLRYLVLHENFHVALKHCVLGHYVDLFNKYQRLSNMAADYVVNGIIEELDPDFKFVERPTKVAPLVDERFAGMSFPQVLKALLEDNDGKDEPQDGEGGDGCMDEHQMAPEDLPQDVREKIEKMVDDANRQGELMSRKLRGEGSGGRDIFGTMQDRNTNWREALIEFINDVCKGDENSRFCPPNKRLLASGFIMPSHFDERVGELVIACDTSGSMHWAYPIVFGEVARVCQHAKPERVRMLWWDTKVAGDQVFVPDDYEKIGDVLAPKGGGGTTVSCVAQYMKEHDIKPVAVIMLTDGYIEDSYQLPDVPVLWGVVQNESFVPQRGKVLRINP